MICKISELITEVPEMGGIAPLFRDYLCDEELPVEIEIRREHINPSLYRPEISDFDLAYCETGRLFFSELLKHDGIFLHASSVEIDGKAYMFSAKSGTGKTTHTRIWCEIFGDKAHVFNDDKTPMRYLNKNWYAYGCPWCGKDHININTKVPVAGICFLKQAKENKIRRLTNQEAIHKIAEQTLYRSKSSDKLDLLLTNVGKLVREIPIFELENRPEQAAALLSYETMKKAAEEIGL